MNTAFYLAIDRLPLGTAVAIEFLGPVVVAAAPSLSWRDALSVLAAVIGVVLIADVQLVNAPLGLGFALLAALLWAGYIVLAKRRSKRPRRLPRRRFHPSRTRDQPGARGNRGCHQTPDPGGYCHRTRFGHRRAVQCHPIPPRPSDPAHCRPRLFRHSPGAATLTAAVIGFVVLHQTPTRRELIGIAAIVSRWQRDDNPKTPPPGGTP